MKTLKVWHISAESRGKLLLFVGFLLIGCWKKVEVGIGCGGADQAGFRIAGWIEGIGHVEKTGTGGWVCSWLGLVLRMAEIKYCSFQKPDFPSFKQFQGESAKSSMSCCVLNTRSLEIVRGKG